MSTILSCQIFHVKLDKFLKVCYYDIINLNITTKNEGGDMKALLVGVAIFAGLYSINRSPSEVTGGDIYYGGALKSAPQNTGNVVQITGQRLISGGQQSWPTNGQSFADKEIPTKYDEYFREAAEMYPLEGQDTFSVLRGVAMVESRMNPNSENFCCSGVMQLHRQYFGRIMDPRENILRGAKFLNYCHKKSGGNIRRTLDCYNPGGEKASGYISNVSAYVEAQQ
ncbi:MAG: lytic transglycosylase domain-containing protein [bacterium]